MSKILVTGAAGFIGSWVIQALKAKNVDVVGLDNFNDYYDVTLKRDRVKALLSDVKIYETDLVDFEGLLKIFTENKISQICHLGAQAGIKHSLTQPFSYELSNNHGTLNLLELCRKFDIKSFIFASSSSVYGEKNKAPFSESAMTDNPISLYAATKKYNELLAYSYHHLYGIHCTGLRFFTVYGPWGRPDMAYFKFTQNIFNELPLEVSSGGQIKRDFTFISDVVSGVLSALEKNYAFEIFNLGNSKPIDLNSLISLIEKKLKKKAKLNFIERDSIDIFETAADISKAKKLLGFNPQINIGEGMERFLEWYEKWSLNRGI
ncbi:MAG: NAD-dependent epimerase/dehydratase family protein [Elusimicrobiota bacterium]